MACIMASAGVTLAHQSCPQLPNQSCLHNLGAHPLLAPAPPGPLLSFLCKLSTSQPSAQVTKVCVTTLVSNTYHAAIHLARAVGRGDPAFQEVQVDSRPSGERCPPAVPLSPPWGRDGLELSLETGIIISQCSGRGNPAATKISH